MRGATPLEQPYRVERKISIHTPHAGSDAAHDRLDLDHDLISIHTPHAGSDAAHDRLDLDHDLISIHTPHAGSDPPSGP